MTKSFNPLPQSPLKPLTVKNILSNNKRAFTLVELIIVVIIVGILASLGLTQYNLMVEKSRTAEAKVRIGVMRQLANGYYLENGSLTGMQNADVGVDYTCGSSDFFRYYVDEFGTYAHVGAARCTSGGKSPNASLAYWFGLRVDFASGQTVWYCHWGDGSSCFGLLPYGV